MDIKPGLYRLVVCYLIKPGFIGLALKKKKIGAGLLNGYGGSIKEGETAQEAVCREVEEETRGDQLSGVILSSSDLTHVATVMFHNRINAHQVCRCKVDMFFTERWNGEPHESDEMGPIEWFNLSEIPYDRMMRGDVEWLPLVLRNPNAVVVGDVYYGPGQTYLTRDSKLRVIGNNNLA